MGRKKSFKVDHAEGDVILSFDAVLCENGYISIPSKFRDSIADHARHMLSQHGNKPGQYHIRVTHNRDGYEMTMVESDRVGKWR